MTNRAYRRGADFERRIRDKLAADGWTVFRTAGSHTPCDLIAIMPNHHGHGPMAHLFGVAFAPVFVQAKGGQAAMTKKARNDFATFARAHGARPLLVTRGMTFNWLDGQEAA